MHRLNVSSSHQDVENPNQSNEFKRISIRGGSRGGIRFGGSGSGSGSRTSPSTRYSNTRTGVRIARPPNSQWVRTLGFFLPISRRFMHRSRSSSNRYTTSSTDSNSYYYCTSADNPNNEIQCYSYNGDDQCCENTDTNQPFCCSSSIPNDTVPDPNRAVKLLAQFFYTLAAITFGIHLFMRRLYR